MPKIKGVFWEGFPERKTPKIRVKTPQISTGPKKFVFTVCVFFHLCKNALTAEIQKGCNLLFFVSIESEPRLKSMSPIMREGKHFRQKQSEPRKANTAESGVSVQTNPRTDKSRN